MTILVTGGLGYIGSHTVLSLINNGFSVVLVDNLSNSNFKQFDKIKSLINNNIFFYNIDVCNEVDIKKVFQKHDIDSIIHFAALKSIPDSFNFPEKYFQNNVFGTLSLISIAKEFGVNKIIFSSTAAIYNENNKFPVSEDGILSFNNPYAETKYKCELLFKEWCSNDPNLSVVILRYFNPIGNHSSGLIGDRFDGKNTNIMPMILKSLNNNSKFIINGNDYKTKDGSPVRDYIHVLDLADAHLTSLEYLKTNKGLEIFNVGTGKGTSVLNLLETFQKVNGVKLHIDITSRRLGDLPICFTDTNKIRKILKWKPLFGIEEMCIDSFTFYQKYIMP